MKTVVLTLALVLACGNRVVCAATPTPTPSASVTPTAEAYNLLKAGKNEEAAAAATNVLKTNPRSAAALVIRAMAELRLQQTEKGLSDLASAIALAPQSKELRLQQCSAFYQSDRLDEAVSACTAAIDIDPEYAAALDERALAHDAKDDAANEALGLEDINSSIAIDSTSAWAFAERCELEIELKKEDIAAPDCDRSLALDPTNGWTWYQRGTLDLDAKDYARAEADLKSALAHHTTVAYATVALAKAQNGQAKYADALVTVTGFIAGHPAVASGYLTRAQAEVGLGKTVEALEDAQKTLSLAKSPRDDDVAAQARALVALLSSAH